MSEKQFHSFTLRVPVEIYLEMAQMAQEDGVYLSQIANRLIQLGLGRSVDLTNKLEALIAKSL